MLDAVGKAHIDDASRGCGFIRLRAGFFVYSQHPSFLDTASGSRSIVRVIGARAVPSGWARCSRSDPAHISWG
jgi:hypothetical protein